MPFEKMREFSYISSEKRLPLCPTCRGDMEMWTGGLFVCERCEDLRSDNYDVSNGIDLIGGQEEYLSEINSSDYAFGMNFTEHEFRGEI